MEEYIQISYLNDFVFCPKSIYFHQLFGEISTRIYHKEAQIRGKAAHSAIEEEKYSSRKDILQGIDIYSAKYGICGKIDLFNIETGVLTERKKHIKKIYDGYVFQLYAQFYGLTEMGYEVRELYLYSTDTNRKYPILLPEDNREMQRAFDKLIYDINNVNLSKFEQKNKEKCAHCVYASLCDEELC